MPCLHQCETRVRSSKAAYIVMSGLLTILAFAGICAAQDAKPTTQNPSVKPAHPIHIVPMVPTAKGPASVPPATAHLSYYGGPVLSNVNVITVFWGNNVDAGEQTTMPSFYAAITDSTYFDLLSEYATNVTPVGGGSGTNQSVGRGSAGGTYTITPSQCGSGPCTIDDTAIQAELLTQINGGHLPAPALDNNGNPTSLYMVYFPPNVTITQQGSQSCVVFCAYHGTGSGTFSSKTIDFGYGVFPDLSRGACALGCGNASTYLDNATSVSSHELVEAVTDVDVGLAATISYPLAWYDSVNGEIGDICNGQQATVTAGGKSWVVQKQWSNALNACVATGKHPVLQSSAPASASSGVPFNLTLTAQNPTSGGTMASFIGTVHFSSSDSAAVLPADYSFTNTDQGSHLFNVTLNTSGSQTVTATETVNGAITASSTISVGGGGNGPLTVSPTSLTFPSTAFLTTSKTLFVTAKNANTVAITVSSVGLTGTNAGDFVIKSNTCGASIAPNVSCKIGVAFAPGTIGLKQATLMLSDSATNSPQLVSLSGTGTPQIKLTPATAGFGTILVGSTSAAKVFTFKSLLTTPVTLGTISITGANAGDFAISSTTCGTSVVAKGSCTITLTFSPTATGLRKATLQVPNNATPNPITSALSGTGK